jgi:hypothetical protein
MTWTAKLVDAKDRNSFWKILVEFSDGKTRVQKAYQFTGTTAQELAAFVRSQARRFNQTDPVDLTSFIGQSIDVTPPVPTDPTPEELARQTWFADFRELQRIIVVTEAVPALLTAQAQSRIDTLRSSLETGWLDSYLGDV